MPDSTFLALYNNFRLHFTDRHLLEYAVKNGNMLMVQTFLHQTHPVQFKRGGHQLLKDAVSNGSFEVFKYLIDSGLFDNQWLVDGYSNIAYNVFNSTPSIVRMVLDPNNFPKDLVDKLISLIPVYVNNIFDMNDESLVIELMPSELPAFKSHQQQRITAPAPAHNDPNAYELPFAPHDEFFIRLSRELIAKSMNSAQSILARMDDNDSRLDGITLTDSMSDEDRLQYGCVREYLRKYEHPYQLMRHYLPFGDCMLIPYFMDVLYHTIDGKTIESYTLVISRMLADIVEVGTATQTRIVYEHLDAILLEHYPEQSYKTNDQYIRDRLFGGELYHSFIISKNSVKSLEVVKYLNSIKAIQKSTLVGHWTIWDSEYTGTLPMLEFLISQDNIIFPSSLLVKMRFKVFKPSWLELVLKNKPDMIGPEMSMVMANLAAASGRLDILNLLLEYKMDTLKEHSNHILDYWTPWQCCIVGLFFGSLW
ncbi:hypothetical protein SAMD00019534_079650 [Acytostelium subglobosum LB1]|uniref:hypothetical protein n=1 Tax=Acytostelium subglobosum LB1 TaxID=1410327 RepID=UPI000644CD0B|nr:hypothetical protein SAMD00019534_079650 [Acytostelium subglobosum LB1]GAM24790.1 hypothetical protein SAMD00019534_079650 [Acytostelium subglobosum LB1]|eukprot:XP_012752459.1 hypothetical protein SAMD00019534_079650 [Acytostelium subglobosum LB1]